jgi:hypothetical protein
LLTARPSANFLGRDQPAENYKLALARRLSARSSSMLTIVLCWGLPLPPAAPRQRKLLWPWPVWFVKFFNPKAWRSSSFDRATNGFPPLRGFAWFKKRKQIFTLSFQYPKPSLQKYLGFEPFSPAILSTLFLDGPLTGLLTNLLRPIRFIDPSKREAGPWPARFFK